MYDDDRVIGLAFDAATAYRSILVDLLLTLEAKGIMAASEVDAIVDKALSITRHQVSEEKDPRQQHLIAEHAVSELRELLVKTRGV